MKVYEKIKNEKTASVCIKIWS